MSGIVQADLSSPPLNPSKIFSDPRLLGFQLRLIPLLFSLKSSDAPQDPPTLPPPPPADK